MKMGKARALLVALVLVAACGKGGSSTTTGGDAGPEGPTKLTAKWTFTGKPASAAECTAHMGQQVYVNLSGTIDPSLHKTVTTDCSKGTLDLGSLQVQDLGEPYLEATLLDDMGKTITIAGVNVMPTLGSTTVTLDFFPPAGTGGMGGMGGMGTTASSTTASTTASSSGGGAGGAGGASASSSSSTTTSTAASSSSSSSSGGAGGADAG